jgi:Terminase large subunit, T4likevirus-type, N-terminal
MKSNRFQKYRNQEDEDDGLLARLTPQQSAFYLADERFPLFVGGFGSGKSTTFAVRAVTDLIDFQGADIGCYAPTYDLLKLITEPFLAAKLHAAGLEFELNQSDHIFTVEDYGSLICRSLSNPDRIVGYEVFRSHVDELDTLKTEVAERSWNQVLARNRQKVYKVDDNSQRILRPNFTPTKKDPEIYEIEPNRVCGYTTPEG